MNDINEKIESFVQKWQEQYDTYMVKRFPSNPNPHIEISYGRKYAKVVREGAVSAFIDLENGDILFPAGWAKPAKHARGNVFSEHNGLEALNTFAGPQMHFHPHVRYLR